MYQPQQFNGVSNYYPAPMPRTTTAQQGLRGYPVSSLEEVRAAVVDFDGSVFMFPDLTNKRIYTKQINLDGTATLNMYERTELPPTTTIDTSNYVSKTDLETAITEIKELINTLQQSIATKNISSNSPKVSNSF